MYTTYICYFLILMVYYGFVGEYPRGRKTYKYLEAMGDRVCKMFQEKRAV